MIHIFIKTFVLFFIFMSSSKAMEATWLPALTADFLQSSDCLVDNLFADLWKSMGMNTLLSKAGFNKRSGTPITELVYVLTLWVWLKKGSFNVAAFVRS
jgi:hypothetical protein